MVWVWEFVEEREEKSWNVSGGWRNQSSKSTHFSNWFVNKSCVDFDDWFSSAVRYISRIWRCHFEVRTKRRANKMVICWVSLGKCYANCCFRAGWWSRKYSIVKVWSRFFIQSDFVECAVLRASFQRWLSRPRLTPSHSFSQATRFSIWIWVTFLSFVYPLLSSRFCEKAEPTV
jgi:hypothetical protein